MICRTAGSSYYSHNTQKIVPKIVNTTQIFPCPRSGIRVGKLEKRLESSRRCGLMKTFSIAPFRVCNRRDLRQRSSATEYKIVHVTNSLGMHTFHLGIKSHRRLVLQLENKRGYLQST